MGLARAAVGRPRTATHAPARRFIATDDDDTQMSDVRRAGRLRYVFSDAEPVVRASFIALVGGLFAILVAN